MRSIIIDLSISSEEYLKRYQQPAAPVRTHSRDGRSIRFPANILQPFVTHSGIQGSFRIQFDGKGKCCGVERL